MKWTVAFLIAMAAVPAHADWSFGVGSEAGARHLDTHLADYRWDTGPLSVYGLDAVARNGRWSLRAGLTLSGTEQATGLPGVTTVPAVGLTEFALHGAATVLTIGSLGVDVGLGIGRLHLDWDPGRLEVDVDGTPVVVDFDAIERWNTALALDLGWDLSSTLRAGVRARASRFTLETAHRRGDSIVEDTESFVSLDATVFVRFLAHTPSTNAENRR